MAELFPLTDAERHFLLHWHHEASGPFWGPATIWCVHHRINPAYGPYPLAELFWRQERRANRTFWTGHRPWVSFQIPWEAVDHFWIRVNTALFFLPRLQGDPRFTPTAFTWQVEGTLTADETNYLRAYNQEMVQSGSGPSIDLAHQQGVTHSSTDTILRPVEGSRSPSLVTHRLPLDEYLRPLRRVDRREEQLPASPS